MSGEPSDYQQVGGQAGLERLMRAYVTRAASDLIIGFMFEGRDLERIVRHEVEHASAHLGGPVGYSGRPLVPVHRALKIHQGHVRRRLALLAQVLRAHGVTEAIIDRWLARDRQLGASFALPTDCVPAPPTSHHDLGS